MDSPFRSEPKLLSESASDDVFRSVSPLQPSREEFEKIWTIFNFPQGTARGWNGASPSAVVGMLQNVLDGYKIVVTPDAQSPFIEGKPKCQCMRYYVFTASCADVSNANAETCVLVCRDETSSYVAAIRLKPAEDSSCMWNLRCDDASTRVIIKEALE